MKTEGTTTSKNPVDGPKAQKVNPSFWVIKCSRKLKNGEDGYDWREYLNQDAKTRHKIEKEWGGPDWIKSYVSLKFIREEFRENDLVVCYQAEGREILGFSRLASGGLIMDGVCSAFNLIPSANAFVLNKPISVEQLREKHCAPKAFTRAGMGAVNKLASNEMRGIVAAVITQYPGEEKGLLSWLKSAGFWGGNRPNVNHSGNPQLSPENAQWNHDQIEKALQNLESRFAGKDHVYVKAKVNALIRKDGPLIKALKRKYNFRCQFPGCKAQIPKKDGGYYCEVGHILAVARGGEATRVNLLVLCPNHHKAIDYGAMEILENKSNRLKLKLNGKISIVKRR